MLLLNFHDWKLHDRAAGERLIWRDEPWDRGEQILQRSQQYFHRVDLLARAGRGISDQLNVLTVGDAAYDFVSYLHLQVRAAMVYLFDPTDFNGTTFIDAKSSDGKKGIVNVPAVRLQYEPNFGKSGSL